jgi:hypothetical protein
MILLYLKFVKELRLNLVYFRLTIVYFHPILGAKAAQNRVKICQFQQKIGGKINFSLEKGQNRVK